MATDTLVPVFMPPLAVLLAHAEKLKGSPLTETEVTRVRDGAVCVMMKASHAEKLIETRGYRDVHPENGWADWHRLRVEMTGNGCLPKIVLCVVSGRDFPERAKRVLEELGCEHEFAPGDAGMAKAFEASASRVAPTLTKVDLEHIATHESVLYVLSKNYPAREAPEVSRTMLRAGVRLLSAGGIAMKCESSGTAHGSVHWKALAERAEAGDAAERGSALFGAFVRYPIGSDRDLYTCGMHLLGQPDLIAARELLPAADAVALFRTFALYLLAECPEGAFAPGHTFRTGDTAPRYRVLWEPCTGYAEDDFFFNPFGRWRFTTSDHAG